MEAGWKFITVIAVMTISIAAASVGPTTAQINQAPQAFRDCSDCPEMVVVPAGSFLMGASEDENKTVYEMKFSELSRFPNALVQKYIKPLLSEQPQHSVTISHAFGMGKYPVTRGEFAAFVRESGYSIALGCTVPSGLKYPQRNDAGWTWPGFSQTDLDPVVCVNWNDAQAYVAWLNTKSRDKISSAGSGPYHLPSEAEWEYAARAGTRTLYWWGDSIGSGNADCNGCDSRWDGNQTAPVNAFGANPFGLSIMHGGAFEWMQDCPHPNYEGAPTDGSSWTTGGSCENRVTRGADFMSRPSVLHSADRTQGEVIRRSNYMGFRVAKTLP